MTSERLLRWLCWTLAVFAIVSAILTVGISQGLLVTRLNLPDSMDFVERLAQIRQADMQANSLFLLSNFFTFGVFLLVSVLGVALRPYAAAGSPRDVMATLFILGGVIGVLSQLVIAGINVAATFDYCDCGYKAEELIAQAKALDVAFSIQDWLAIGTLSIVGLAAAVAASLVDVSAAWRWLSYGIAAALLLAAALQIAGHGDLADLVGGVAAGIGVPIWAIVLALATPRLAPSAANAG